MDQNRDFHRKHRILLGMSTDMEMVCHTWKARFMFQTEKKIEVDLPAITRQSFQLIIGL